MSLAFMGRFSEAKEYLLKALECEPANPEFLDLLDVIQKSKITDKGMYIKY